jgi:pimeloyl-ACP methyl ester carboxylesterase
MRALAAGGLDAFLVEMPLHFAVLDKNAAERIVGSYEAAEWFLAGHSLGGVAAAACAGEHPETIKGLVFLASYPAEKVPDGVRALSIRGDRDGVMNQERYEAGRVLFPTGTEEIILQGANHAQFGDYGPQSGDNEAQITAAQQQAQTAEAILNWIR